MAVEMKVTNKKGTTFYARSIASFFNGVEAKEAEDGKAAVEARPPVETLKISGLGEAVNVALAAASKADDDSVARITKIETGYPEMDSGRGCAQVTITMKKLEAPYLHKFYKIYSKKGIEIAKQVQEAVQENPFTAQEKAQQILKDQAEFYENECKPILRQSFAIHDKDGNGILDKDESALLFSHIAEEIEGILMAQNGNQLKDMLPKVIAAVCQVVGDDEVKKNAIQKCVTKMLMELPPLVKKWILNSVADYKTNKAERDADLFKFVDVNGDGKLQLDEVLNLWSSEGGEESNVMKLMRIFGLDQGKINSGFQLPLQEALIKMLDAAEKTAIDEEFTDSIFKEFKTKIQAL